MTFDAVESSRLSQPVEYITLKNGAQNWYYTNSNRTETIGSRTFEPLPYTRTEPAFSKADSDGQIKLTVPNDIPIVDYYGTLPASEISTLQIERSHRNDPDAGVQIYWKGAVASVAREGNFATILGLPLTQLTAQVPRYTYSALCNWFLYEDRCALNRTDWRHQGTVTTIDADGVGIIVNGLSTRASTLQAAVDVVLGGTPSPNNLSNYWTNGYCENAAGEKRMIYESSYDADPDKIRILQPFRDLSVNDPISVYAGCDRTRRTCRNKFLNNTKHGGFPDIPIVNPFTTELPHGNARSQRKVFYQGQRIE